MRYSVIRKYDVSNGPAIRVTLFVTGCTHNCKACFNEEIQDFNAGELWTDREEESFVDIAKSDTIKGISILGGEPLQQLMDDSLKKLLKRLKDEVPDKEIWLWTGDLFEEAILIDKKKELIDYLDVIIDGKFILEEKDLSLKYRGSRNQRIIDVKKSLKAGEVIEREV